MREGGVGKIRESRGRNMEKRYEEWKEREDEKKKDKKCIQSERLENTIALEK